MACPFIMAIVGLGQLRSASAAASDAALYALTASSLLRFSLNWEMSAPATNARSPFEKLLAAGLTSLLGFQAFIIIGGILRVLPLTGVTLPFVSYGGSSLISNYIILAILVRISHNSVVQAAEEQEENARSAYDLGVSRETKARWKAVRA